MLHRDTGLAGVGLRIRPTGNDYRFVRPRLGSKHRRVTPGRSDDLAAELARARRLLAEVALDGLPGRAVAKATPIMSDFVETCWMTCHGSGTPRRQSATGRRGPASLRRSSGQCAWLTSCHPTSTAGGTAWQACARGSSTARCRFSGIVEACRIGAALREQDMAHPAQVAIMRRLLGHANQQ